MWKQNNLFTEITSNISFPPRRKSRNQLLIKKKNYEGTHLSLQVLYLGTIIYIQPTVKEVKDTN